MGSRVLTIIEQGCGPLDPLGFEVKIRRHEKDIEWSEIIKLDNFDILSEAWKIYLLCILALFLHALTVTNNDVLLYLYSWYTVFVCVCVYVCVCLQVLLNQFLHSPIFFDLCWRILRILPLNQKTRRCHAQHAGVFTTPMRIIDFVCLFPTVLRSLGVAGLRSSPPTCFEGYLKKAGCNYMSEAVVKGTFDEMCFFSGDMYCLCFFTIFTFLTCPESSFRILVTSFSTSSTSQCQSPGQYIHQY